MDRLDYYDIKPAGLEAYLSNYGYHISKPMYEWAVSMMKDRNGNRFQQPWTKEQVSELLKNNGITLKNDKAYDAPYVAMMCKADYLGSSVPDEAHLAKFVQDYLDDADGSKTRAFDELYAKLVALGIPVIWEDLI